MINTSVRKHFPSGSFPREYGKEHGRENLPTRNSKLSAPSIVMESKPGTSNVGAISKAQKAQSFQKCKRGDLLGFLKVQFVAKLKEGPFVDISKKSLTKPKKGRSKSHSDKKLERGTLLGFVFQFRGFWMRSKSSTEYFW